jgi:hypothetical protein
MVMGSTGGHITHDKENRLNLRLSRRVKGVRLHGPRRCAPLNSQRSERWLFISKTTIALVLASDMSEQATHRRPSWLLVRQTASDYTHEGLFENATPNG